jgi:phosphatidylinositol-3,4,5-trisphosphate 3-phosphatase and dual-specificity protein phosphatase PTEN
MGYPGAGFYSLYRNDMGDVIKYFQKYHGSKVKIYNMCNDKFVDVDILRLKTKRKQNIKLAYFPMMDHNPGPLPMVFKFAIDAVIFLACDPQNTIAVHCKAGKGRTGLAICAYLLF